MTKCDVHVVDEEKRPPTIVRSFTTIREAEEYIAGLCATQAAKVERGGFGIDAPENKVNP